MGVEHERRRFPAVVPDPALLGGRDWVEQPERVRVVRLHEHPAEWSVAVDRTWGSDDWLAEREQHRADEDAERRHETHEHPQDWPECHFCISDWEQDSPDETEEN